MGSDVEQKVADLVLLLLYLTGWQEKERVFPYPLFRSWKGYPFEILNELEEQRLLTQSRRSKSVVLTEEGIKRAKSLEKKYLEQER